MQVLNKILDRASKAYQKIGFRMLPKPNRYLLKLKRAFSRLKVLESVKRLDQILDRASKAYQTLRVAMANNQAREEEATFFCHELETIQRISTTPLSVKIMTSFYKITSNYGQSIARPLIGLMAVLFFFGGLFMGFDHGYWEGVSTAVQNVVRPFSDVCTARKGWICVIGITEFIFTTSLLSVLIIAIRRHLRKS